MARELSTYPAADSDSITVRPTREASINLTSAVFAPGREEMQQIISRAGAPPYCRNLGADHADDKYRHAEDTGVIVDYLTGYAYLPPGLRNSVAF